MNENIFCLYENEVYEVMTDDKVMQKFENRDENIRA